MSTEFNRYAELVNRILLALVLLVAGLTKLFIVKPSAVTEMLTGMSFPVPVILAWILILSEIVFGIAILVKWNLKQTVIPAIIIFVIAAFTFWTYGPGAQNGPNWGQVLIHLALASNYWLLGARSK